MDSLPFSPQLDDLCAIKPEPSVYLEHSLPPCHWHEMEFLFLISFRPCNYFLREQGDKAVVRCGCGHHPGILRQLWQPGASCRSKQQKTLSRRRFKTLVSLHLRMENGKNVSRWSLHFLPRVHQPRATSCIKCISYSRKMPSVHISLAQDLTIRIQRTGMITK
jgi:hypothetical protein